MNKTIAHELYKISHSVALLLLIITSVIVYVFILRFGNQQMNSVNTFYYSITNPIPVMWISVIHASALIGSDFQARSINATVYSGKSRINILISKAFCYFLTIFVIQSLSLIINMYLYSYNLKEVLFNISLLGQLGLCFLLTMGTASIPLMLTMLFNDLYVSLGVSIIFTYTMQQLFGYVKEMPNLQSVVLFYPAYLQINLTQINYHHNVYMFIFVPLVYIVTAVAISIFMFYYRKLK